LLEALQDNDIIIFLCGSWKPTGVGIFLGLLPSGGVYLVLPGSSALKPYAEVDSPMYPSSLMLRPVDTNNQNFLSHLPFCISLPI
jgi:hypothetical protein